MEDLPVMWFEMKNLTSFPMEKLCFDLKLEVLEPMESWDVLELAMVNQELQGMLVRDPSIVFGKHISEIRFYDERMEIRKFSNSIKMELNVFSHFSFVKKIRSCHYLGLGWSSKEAYEKFFSNFHASIKEGAQLNILFRIPNEEEDDDYNEEYHGDIVDRMVYDQVSKDLIENFIVAGLKNCESISIKFCCYFKDLFRFYHSAFLKTQIKWFFMDGRFSLDCIDLIAQQIVTTGIPSKNPEAAIFIHSHKSYLRSDLSQYPGMLRIDGKNRRRLLKQANDLARSFCEEWSFSGFRGFCMTGSSVFRRRIDSTKDCICVSENDGCWYFLAFYVSVD